MTEEKLKEILAAGDYAYVRYDKETGEFHFPIWFTEEEKDYYKKCYLDNKAAIDMMHDKYNEGYKRGKQMRLTKEEIQHILDLEDEYFNNEKMWSGITEVEYIQKRLNEEV